MKRNIFRTVVSMLLFTSIILLMLLAGYVVTQGKNSLTHEFRDVVDYIPMRASAYCIHGTTSNGSRTHRGICAAKPEWIGLTAAIYLNNDGELGEFLGYYEVKDTGEDNIRNGKVIDIWMETENECFQFGNKKVFVVLIKGVG